MRDRIARILLFSFGVFAIAAGAFALLGISSLPSRLTAILVGIGALAGGIAMVRSSHGPNPTIGPPKKRS